MVFLPRLPSPPIIPGLPILPGSRPFTRRVEEDDNEEDVGEDGENEEFKTKVIEESKLNTEEQDLINRIRANPTLKDQVVNYAKGREKINPEQSLHNWEEGMRDFGVEPGTKTSNNFHEGLIKSLGKS